MRFLSSLLVVVLTPLLILFAVFNRSDVALVWSPVHQPADLPLYFLVLAPLAGGFVLGLLLGWISGSRVRGRSRRQRREIKQLERELADLKPEDSEHKGLDDFYPALVKKEDT